MTMHDEPSFHRIAVLGSSGAGKSTCAVLLGEVTGLPVVHLDKEHWQPGWTEPDETTWRVRLAEFAARPEWIIDGQYGNSLPARLTRADLAIFIDLPTRICLWRIVKRWLLLRGRVRPDMGEGCPEKLDGEFLFFVATFRRVQRPKIVAALAASEVRTVWLRSAHEQALFADKLRNEGLTAAICGAQVWS